MNINLEYGAKQPLSVEIADERLAGVYGELPALGLDCDQAVHENFARPLGFPPVATATTSGDKVILPLAPNVARGEFIAGSLVKQFLESGSAVADVSVIFRPDDPVANRITAHFAASGLGEIELVAFDANQTNECSYLAATRRDAQPIYLARRIIDADLVVPILPLRPKGSFSAFGFRGGLYPTFSNDETRAHFGNLAVLAKSRRKELAKSCEEAWWLLGALCCLGVAGGMDQVFGVVAGEPKQVAAALREKLADQLSPNIVDTAPLAIAVISSSAPHTWRELAAALAATSRLVSHGGTMVICTNLGSPPPAGVAKFLDDEGSLANSEQWVTEGLSDVDVAWQIAQTTESLHVALLSHLNPVLVEDLGMIPLHGPEDIPRIIARHPRCSVLKHAQLVVPHVARTMAEEERHA
jgi:hypothetical protein